MNEAKREVDHSAQRGYGMRYYRANLAAGKCRSCPKLRLSGSKSMCEYHWFMNVAHARMGSTKFTEALRQKLRDQNYRCAYTGMDLVPAMNCSLDHIKPTKRFPELKGNINNVQWVLHHVNMAKRGLDEDAFIQMCRLVAKGGI